MLGLCLLVVWERLGEYVTGHLFETTGVHGQVGLGGRLAGLRLFAYALETAWRFAALTTAATTATATTTAAAIDFATVATATAAAVSMLEAVGWVGAGGGLVISMVKVVCCCEV